MPTVGIFVQRIYVFDLIGPQWIQVDVADQLAKVRLFLAENRFVAILKQVAVPVMTAVEINGMPG